MQENPVKSILISQPEPEAGKSPFYDLAKKYKLKVDFRPFIQVDGIEARDFRKFRIAIGDYKFVIFTSKHSIDHYFRLCEEMRVIIDPETKYYVISESIGVYMQKYTPLRKRKVFYGTGNLLDLASLMSKNVGGHYLMPISEVSQKDFVSKMDSIGITVKEAIMYNTVASDLSDLAQIKYDILIFYSPWGIKSMFENFPDFVQGNTRIAVFGEATKQATIDSGLIPNIIVPQPGIPSMTMAIEEYIKKVNK
jgi:uroporphyrinogen-III synthase